MGRAAGELVDALLRVADADEAAEADIHALLGNMTLDVVGECALGGKIGAQAAGAPGAPAAPLVAAVNEVFSCMEPISGSGRLHDPWAVGMMVMPAAMRPFWRLAAALSPAPVVMRLLKADVYVREQSKRMLVATRTQAAAAAEKPGAPSLFALLCADGGAAVRRHGVPPLTDEQMVAQSHVMLMAGVETTANALAHTLYLLAQHPDAAARVRAEADATPQPSAADVADGRFAFTEAALKEAMRLMPPAPLLSRLANEDTSLGGVPIPAGTAVLVTLTAIMRDAAHFPQPDAFRPERFLPGSAEAAARHPLAWAPFGAGPRQCIGARFAVLEAVLTLARLFRDVTIELPRDAPPLAIREGITNGPAAGLRVRVARRKHAGAAA
jgi:thromboxane-A synthase/cytochrome P450 family 3 subfamily A